MAVTNRYSIYPSVFTGASTLTLTQIWGVSFDPGGAIDDVVPHGALDRAACILSHAMPRVTVTTCDLASVFAAVSPTVGLNCTSGALIQFQSRLHGGTFDTGSGHEALTTGSSCTGFLAPGNLSAQQNGGIAEMSLNYWALGDPANAETVPIAPTAATLASSPARVSEFYFGPVYHNGTIINGCIGSSIDYGIDFRPAPQNGEVWPTKGSIYNRGPTITLTLTNQAYARTMGNLFNNALAGTLACYFSKGTASGARVAYATTSHCKVSCATGVLSPTSVSVSRNDDLSMNVMIRPTGVISTSVASAIP